MNPTYKGKFNFSYSSLNRNRGLKKSYSSGNRFVSRIYKFNKSRGVGCEVPPPCECLDYDTLTCECMIPNLNGGC